MKKEGMSLTVLGLIDIKGQYNYSPMCEANGNIICLEY